MAALRLRDLDRRALVLQAAFEFGLAAILAMFAVWEGANEETARCIFFGVASAGLFAWATWNVAADEYFVGAYGNYQQHPEAKAADSRGEPAGTETIGLLGRLRVQQRGKLVRIGKEVDRLDEDQGAALKPDLPIEYERDDLAEDIEYLATFPQAATASDLRLTERGWRKIIKVRPNSKATTVERIREVAALYRVRFGD
jgi:hypothetical protein